MRKWERKGYEVREVEFDHDLHEFEVVKDGEVIASIIPADIEDMNRIISALDAGEDVDGWEDGMGNTIAIPQNEVQFIVPAKKYFEADADRLEQVQEGDLVLVTIDFENEKADYIWYGDGENPANFPAIEDDYEGVLQLWGEMGRPQD